MAGVEDEIRADPRELGELVLWLLNRLYSFPCPMIRLGQPIEEFIEELRNQGYTIRQGDNNGMVLERVVEERTTNPEAFGVLRFMLDVFLPDWRIEHYKDRVEYEFSKWSVENLNMRLVSKWRLVLVPNEYRLRSVCEFVVSNVEGADGVLIGSEPGPEAG